MDPQRLIDPRDFRKTLAVAMALPLLLMSVLAAVLGWQVFRLLALTEEVQRIEQIIAEAHRTEKLLIDHESGVRGYLLTGQPEFLQPYLAARRSLPAVLKRLDRLVRHPGQVTRLHEVNRTYLEWLKFGRGALLLSDPAAARRYVTPGRGKLLMDAMRATLGEFVRVEEQLRGRRVAASTEAAWRAGWVALGMALLLGGLLAFASRRQLLDVSRAYERTLATELRQAAELRDREALFDAFMNNSPAVAFMKDSDGRLVFMNEPMRRLFAGGADLLGKTDFEWLPEDVARQNHANDRAVLASGRPTQLVQIVPAPDGEHHWLVYRFPFRDASGQVLLGGVALDVTDRERAEAEIRRMNAELERRVEERTTELIAANRELEAFSYSVSHDLRAPLRAIDGFSRVLLEDHAEVLEADGRQHLDRVCAAAQRMGQLIDDLLELSRITRSEMVRLTVDLTALAREVAAELRRAEPGRQVEVSVQEGLRSDGDPRLLRAVLENLIGNAWKFTAGRETARIEVGAVSASANLTNDKPAVPVFFVRDDGVGFDMAYAGKLFAPFQRLHRVQEFPGTGVGLASVQRVVRRHGGRIWVEAAPGAGATFFFTLQAEVATLGSAAVDPGDVAPAAALEPALTA